MDRQLDEIVDDFPRDIDGPLTSVPNTTLTQSEKEGDLVGNYTLLEPIGEGEFGSVWRAEQHEHAQWEVALKVLKMGMDTWEVLARFEQEREVLALMAHPRIAQVLDAGARPSGRPIFVMELVQELPMTQYRYEHQFTTEQRLALFSDVCRAVQHAHQKDGNPPRSEAFEHSRLVRRKRPPLRKSGRFRHRQSHREYRHRRPDADDPGQSADPPPTT